MSQAQVEMMKNLDSLWGKLQLKHLYLQNTSNNAPFSVHRTLLCVTCRGEHLISKESCFAVRAHASVPMRRAGMCWFHLMLI
jgi:hypothetical protein